MKRYSRGSLSPFFTEVRGRMRGPLLQLGLSPEAIDPCEGQTNEAALDVCRQEANTTAEGFPSINAPGGSTATVTATDWATKVATLPECLPSGWRHDSAQPWM